MLVDNARCFPRLRPPVMIRQVPIQISVIHYEKNRTIKCQYAIPKIIMLRNFMLFENEVKAAVQ